MATGVTQGALQESLYEFPYHHLPRWTEQSANRVRVLKWGLEYACYIRHLAEHVRQLKPESVLEVGCGDGRFISELSFVRRRVGVDISTRAIAQAKAFAPDVEFLNEPVGDIKESFDVACLVEVLEHIPDDIIPTFLQDVAARVRPGGTIVISVPSVNVKLHPKHFRHYDYAVLRRQWEGAGLNWSPVRLEHVCRKSWVMKWYCRATVNRWVTFSINSVENAIWRWYWKNCRVADDKSGTHVVALLRV